MYHPTGLLGSSTVTIRLMETKLGKEEFVPTVEQQFQGRLQKWEVEMEWRANNLPPIVCLVSSPFLKELLKSKY